jgi:hypothetical protein
MRIHTIFNAYAACRDKSRLVTLQLRNVMPLGAMGRGYMGPG